MTKKPLERLIGGSDYKLIYRHYATLYFVFCVDSSESELGILDLIQVFVETLDKCFENVCELDLIFHMDKTIASKHEEEEERQQLSTCIAYTATDQQRYLNTDYYYCAGTVTLTLKPDPV
ncbi:hypothetical protein ACOMHN_049554 [Nucella lapillus]